jgi:hypothetical protein
MRIDLQGLGIGAGRPRLRGNEVEAGVPLALLSVPCQEVSVREGYEAPPPIRRWGRRQKPGHGPAPREGADLGSVSDFAEAELSQGRVREGAGDLLEIRAGQT